MVSNTRQKDRDTTADEQLESRTEAGGRWVCPFCGTSRVTRADDDEESEASVRRRINTALTAHVNASAGAGHGARNTLPDEFDPDRIDQYVEFEGE